MRALFAPSRAGIAVLPHYNTPKGVNQICRSMAGGAFGGPGGAQDKLVNEETATMNAFLLSDWLC